MGRKSNPRTKQVKYFQEVDESTWCVETSSGEPGINRGVERLLCDEMTPNLPCSAM